MRKIAYNEESVLADKGFFFAQGIFETIRWDKAPVLLDNHIERLKQGMKKLGLCELEESELRQYLGKLNVENKVVKITVTEKNILITTRDIPYGPKNYIEGWKLTLSKVLRNSTSRLCYIKSTGYIENILEKNLAVKNGFNDALFLNEKGNVTETTCANIFIVKDKKIITPKINEGLLSGIIRGWIINNFKVNEENININDVYNADEVFVTNSLMGIMQVKSIDDVVYDNNRFTTVKEIQHKYEKMRLQLGGKSLND